MRIQHLIAFLLVIGLGAIGAMAATYTVYPTTETNGSGSTDNLAKTGGEVLIYGGATTGTGAFKANGYIKFDLSTLPEGMVPTRVEFNYYINYANYPWYSFTPVTLDPNAFGTTAAALWADIEAEKSVGYYNYVNGSSGYPIGWYTVGMGGTIVADITAATAQNWLAVGGASRDGTDTCYLEIDGNTDVNIPYLVITDDPQYLPPNTVTCAVNGDDVALTWVNADVYDSIDVFDGATLLATILGTDVAYTDLAPPAGSHSYTICGIVAAVPFCSEPCDITTGTCDDVLVDLGSIDCPGSLAVSGDTTGADDYCVDDNGDHHYMFEVVTPGSYELSLCSSNWDTRLYINDDMCCGNQIGYDDDDCVAPDYDFASVIIMDLYPGTYYVQVGGYGSNEGVYDLNITCLGVLAVPPTDLTCTENGADVNLVWTNGDTYDSVEVYGDDVLLATLTGTDTTYTVVSVARGGHCYYVCGVVGVESYCSDTCCGIYGFVTELLWDFEVDDGGFITDGTTGWQWGASTYGPCFDSADGNVWGTNLDGDYDTDLCLLLESSHIDFDVYGGIVCIEHCYDIEPGYDGGVVGFTTNGGVWYEDVTPLDGYDGVISGWSPLCAEVEGKRGFTGDSGGWVTDCWELTNQDYIDNGVGLRFAFGSDSAVVASGWLIDNITVYRTPPHPHTIDCSYVVTPLSGTLPLTINHNVTLTNILSGGAVLTRRIAGRINVNRADGLNVGSWRAGYTQLAPGATFTSTFNTNLPAVAAVLGTNVFTLVAEDVTPAPYNQSPYPQSGDTCTQANVVVTNAP